MTLVHVVYDSEKVGIAQGSNEWHQARLGKATASRISDIVATIKTGYAASRAKYAGQLIAERLTGVPADTYSNAAMAWGTQQEPNARLAYGYFHECMVTQVGFIDHPTIAMSGCSPDGLVGEDGLVEIKCPDTHTHIDTLLGKNVKSEYITQMQWQMACTGRSWCDFVSYDPRLPENNQLFTQRITRNDMVIDRLEKEVKLFLAEIDDTIAKLRKL